MANMRSARRDKLRAKQRPKGNRHAAVAAARARGRRHEAEELPCQDDVRAYRNRTVAIVALADGAGSARLAEIGARLAVDELVRCLKRQFRMLTRMADDDAKRVIIQAIRARITAEANGAGAVPGDYACTLLFAATNGRHWLLGQVGDGRVGVQRHDGAWQPLPLATRGEFRNETTFVTSGNALEAFHLTRADGDSLMACVLMSDGAEEALYQRSSGLFAPAVSSMATWVGAHTQGVVQRAIAKNLRDLIRNRTHDDVSVAILRTLRQ